MSLSRQIIQSPRLADILCEFAPFARPMHHSSSLPSPATAALHSPITHPLSSIKTPLPDFSFFH
ncbi:hypothetical protein E2C01_072179 [Portunus trituberculatus]|uniref:Uncharacterized protein n=1 Tax=Portunus trituberculatus TaxID=210409 RepID=A0A5B7I6H0_PORTR|nr:hypothetical protein [Portunus trituberculatus]